MCGIIGAFNTVIKDKKKEINLGMVNKDIIDMYQDQYKRGQEGFGIIRIGTKFDVEVDRSCEPTKFMLDLYMKESRMILAHHRSPTSTENKISQTHPILVSNATLKFDYLLIHNGIINNSEEMKVEHEKLTFKYQTLGPKHSTAAGYDITAFNDSESLAIELALFIEKHTNTLRTRGSAAFMMLQVDKETKKAVKLYFGRDTAPLMLNMTRGKLRLSSTGAGNEIKENILYWFNVDDEKMKMQQKPFKMAESLLSPYKGYDTRGYGSAYGSAYRGDTGAHNWRSARDESDFAMIETKDGNLFKEAIKNQGADEIKDSLEEVLEARRTLIENDINEYFNNIMEGYISEGAQGDPESLIDLITEDVIAARDLAVIAHAEIALAETAEANGDAKRHTTAEEKAVLASIKSEKIEAPTGAEERKNEHRMGYHLG